MNPIEYLPSNALKPFIRSYRVIESKDGSLNRVLPDTSLTLAFRVTGQVSYIGDINEFILPAITFSGLRKSYRLIHYIPETTTIIVLFKESGAAAFFNQGIHELYEQSVSLENYCTLCEVSMVEEQLESSHDNRMRIEVIEQFLLSKLTRHGDDKLITEAIVKINSSNGNIRIKELAKYLHISQDAFEKRFRRVTGATPKQFSHIVKMKSFVHRRQTNPSFINMAFENGYCDQSHFNKDIKMFTGQTPTDFFRSASYW